MDEETKVLMQNALNVGNNGKKGKMCIRDRGKSVWGYLYSNEEVLSVCEKVGISPGFFSIDALSLIHILQRMQ